MKRYKWLILRRISQALILALFLTGTYFEVKIEQKTSETAEALNLLPVTGLTPGLAPPLPAPEETSQPSGPAWSAADIVEGSLNSADILDIVALTDPFVFLQGFFASGWDLLETTAAAGAAIVLLFYFIVGGRVYCAWVCPVNPVTDLAHWLRIRMGIKRRKKALTGNERYLFLALVLVLSFWTGAIAFEFMNPVSMLHRGLLYGMGLGWVILAVIFLYDLFIMPRGWCSHWCPIGGFYSLVGRFSLLRVRFHSEKCDQCGDCFPVCPEPRVLKPSISDGVERVLSGKCSNCGNCIDVCHTDALDFGTRFYKSAEK